MAVLAASSSIMAVFFPVAFMKGLIGRFFYQFGLSVALSVLISVIISLTLTPMLCSRLLKPSQTRGRIFRLLERGFEVLESAYARVLNKALAHRWLTLGLALVVFAGGVAFIPLVPKTFVTQADESRFMVNFELPSGTSLQKTDQTARKLERILFAQPEVSRAMVGIGLTGTVNKGLFFVNLKPVQQRRASQAEVMARMRRLFAQEAPRAVISVESVASLGGAMERNADIQYVIQGPSVAELDKVSAAIMAELRARPGFVDVDSDLRLIKPEVKVVINRDLADDLGVDVQSIAQNFYILLGGQNVATFKQGGDRYDIRLRAAPEARSNPEDLFRLVLRSSTGEMIQTPNLLKFQEGLGPASINRYNRRQAVTIYANLDGVPLAEGLDQVNQIAARHIPQDPTWSTALSGSSSAFAESFRYLLYAVGVAVLLIYMVLSAQFESFVHPFTVLMSVPLALVGGLGMLLVTGKTLDIFSFIGFIMLLGIVTKNAILVVDYANQLRSRGLEREDALKKVGPVRLRPILMTALTTAAAVVPVALFLSEGGETRAPMGAAVIGGMLTSTFLTLLVIPCVYTVMDDLAVWLKGRFSAAQSDQPSPASFQPR